jgi:ATP-dependent Clp protease ATP-binding subunit ClpX
LIGRLPVLAHLDPLTKEDLIRIMTEPRNALIRQYKRLFELEGITLHVTDGAIEFIAEKALEYKLGARGLRSICEAVMTDAMYELPSKRESDKFELNVRYAKDKLNKSRLNKLRAA